MEISVQVEKPTKILRKLTIQVPADAVQSQLEKGWHEVQKTAKIKGFRQGLVPLAIVKQYYGEDVRHRVFHHLVDESYKKAVTEQNLRTVGSPKIEMPGAKTESEDHAGHDLVEGKDLTFIATVEVMPDIELKFYLGLSLSQKKVHVGDEDVEKKMKYVLDAHAELIPASGGLVLADGSSSGRPVRAGDFVELVFQGKVMTEAGFQEREDMKGTRVVEIGSNSLIPGFEDQLIGLRGGESKTFQIPFPNDFHEAALAGKEAEFSVTVHEVKEKKLPELNDEFTKGLGYENVADMREKLRTLAVEEQTEESNQRLRSDLLRNLIEKNEFEIPEALIRAQTRSLIEDLVAHLKERRFEEALIQETVKEELPNLMKRAEIQVRSTLLLQKISEKENISVGKEEVDQEIKRLSGAMQIEEGKLLEFYSKNPGRLESLSFKLLEDKTIQFLIEKAEVKTV